MLTDDHASAEPAVQLHLLLKHDKAVIYSIKILFLLEIQQKILNFDLFFVEYIAGSCQIVERRCVDIRRGTHQTNECCGRSKDRKNRKKLI